MMITTFFKTFIALLSIHCVLGCGSVGNGNPTTEKTTKVESMNISDTMQQLVNFNENIIEADSLVWNNGTWESLFKIEAFLNIYENGDRYIDIAAKFLSDINFNVHQKTVCIYSMQKTHISNYSKFFNECCNLFFLKTIDELLLQRAILPSFGKRKSIVENYQNASITANLKKIQLYDKTSDKLKLIIHKILSGDVKSNLESTN